MGRLMRNVVKARHVVGVSIARVKTWGLDEDVDAVREWLEDADRDLEEIESRVQVLVDKNWMPPKKSLAIHFKEGEEVQISSKHRKKYLDVYSPDVVSDLIVTKVLPSGEIAVKHGRALPFIVAKSHIERKKSEDEERG